MSNDSTDLNPSEREAADRAAIAEVIEKAKIVSVTTIRSDPSALSSDVALVSRPLARQGDKFDGNLYFLVPGTSDLADQVRQNPAVNVALETSGNYLSIAGTGAITTDPALIDSLWSAAAEAWFEDGRSDSAVSVLQVHADSAELQSADGPAILALAKYAKAIVTKEKPDIGDSTRVDL